jgi:hypothetical protein
MNEYEIENILTDELKEQILEIRRDGKYNMFDVYNVQKEAYDKGFYRLVLFLEGSREQYINFILTGSR